MWMNDDIEKMILDGTISPDELYARPEVWGLTIIGEREVQTQGPSYRFIEVADEEEEGTLYINLDIRQRLEHRDVPKDYEGILQCVLCHEYLPDHEFSPVDSKKGPHKQGACKLCRGLLYSWRGYRMQKIITAEEVRRKIRETQVRHHWIAFRHVQAAEGVSHPIGIYGYTYLLCFKNWRTGDEKVYIGSTQDLVVRLNRHQFSSHNEGVRDNVAMLSHPIALTGTAKDNFGVPMIGNVCKVVATAYPTIEQAREHEQAEYDRLDFCARWGWPERYPPGEVDFELLNKVRPQGMEETP